MKAVLVIDMPDGVSLDEWYAVKVIVDRLKATEEELIYGIPFVESKLFRFVPLRPLPCKKYMRQIPSNVLEMGKRKRDFIIQKVDVDNSYVEGWNDVIDEILGETE